MLNTKDTCVNHQYYKYYIADFEKRLVECCPEDESRNKIVGSGGKYQMERLGVCVYNVCNISNSNDFFF